MKRENLQKDGVKDAVDKRGMTVKNAKVGSWSCGVCAVGPLPSHQDQSMGTKPQHPPPGSAVKSAFAKTEDPGGLKKFFHWARHPPPGCLCCFY